MLKYTMLIKIFILCTFFAIADAGKRVAYIVSIACIASIRCYYCLPIGSLPGAHGLHSPFLYISYYSLSSSFNVSFYSKDNFFEYIFSDELFV